MKIRHFELNNEKLTLNKDEYSLPKILEIEARHLATKDHAIRIFSFSFLFSVIGWVFLPVVGAVLFVIGALVALVTAKKFELRALFKGSDDAGDQWSTLSRSSKSDDFTMFSKIATEVTKHKKHI